MDVGLVLNKENLGWGKAINTYIDSQTWSNNQILGIAAHDIRLYGFREELLIAAFADPSVQIAVPDYRNNPVDITYRVERGFRANPRSSNLSERVSPLVIGQATFNFIRPMRIKDIRYDENFFIYGCESEIFLRIRDLGLKVVQLNGIQIENCTTDSSSLYRTLAFTINSLYLAKKRLGLYGYLMRAMFVALSCVVAAIKLDWFTFNAKINALTHSILNGGKGFAWFIKTRKNVHKF
jgi:GT2 family glycosyltransferase